MRGRNRTALALATAVTGIGILVAAGIMAAASDSLSDDTGHGAATSPSPLQDLQSTTDRLDHECKGWRDGGLAVGDDERCAELLSQLDAAENRLMGQTPGGPVSREPAGSRHVETPVVKGG